MSKAMPMKTSDAARLAYRLVSFFRIAVSCMMRCPKMKNGVAVSVESMKRGRSMPMRLHRMPQNPASKPNPIFTGIW